MTLKVYRAKIYGFIVQRFSACLSLKQIFMFQHCYNSHHELFDIYRSNDNFTTQRNIYWTYVFDTVTKHVFPEIFKSLVNRNAKDTLVFSNQDKDKVM